MTHCLLPPHPACSSWTEEGCFPPSLLWIFSFLGDDSTNCHSSQPKSGVPSPGSAVSRFSFGALQSSTQLLSSGHYCMAPPWPAGKCAELARGSAGTASMQQILGSTHHLQCPHSQPKHTHQPAEHSLPFQRPWGCRAGTLSLSGLEQSLVNS